MSMPFMKHMNWIEESRIIFSAEKPENFGNYDHCDECFEYNELLKSRNLDNLNLEDVCPSSDPFCFCSDEGIKYFMPALVRLCFDTNDFFFSQLISHLEKDGKENSLFASCSEEQKAFISSFIDYMINNYTEKLEQYRCDHAVFRAYEVWS